MARHKNPQYNRKRLVVAGIAAVTVLGAAVGVGIYGSALADRGNPDPVASEECLPAPGDNAPPPEENAPPEEEQQGDQQGQDQDGQQGRPNRWAAEAPLALNGERPQGAQPGGNDGGGNGGGDNNGGGGNDDGDIDYGGPQPPEQAPEEPGDGMDEFPGGEQCEDELGPFADDFIDINDVEPNNLADSPEVQEGGVNGTFTVDCGTNEEGHFNSANMIAAPGNENGAQHTHDYVGNVTTDGFSDDESLSEGDTTCVNEADRSAYFWPVIRIRNEGSDAVDPLNAHNIGDIAPVASAEIQFRGNAQEEVEAAPRFLRILTGDAKSSTNGGANANAKWTCSGFEDRITTKYPLCPEGSQTVRIADFPGCNDGNTDSANHRDHLAFADENGNCPDGFQAIPQLRITLSYDLPQGVVFALDAFPEELHNPITDHNDFVNVMDEELMDQVVDCINNGEQCVNQR